MLSLQVLAFFENFPFVFTALERKLIAGGSPTLRAPLDPFRLVLSVREAVILFPAQIIILGSTSKLLLSPSTEASSTKWVRSSKLWRWGKFLKHLRWWCGFHTSTGRTSEYLKELEVRCLPCIGQPYGLGSAWVAHASRSACSSGSRRRGHAKSSKKLHVWVKNFSPTRLCELNENLSQRRPSTVQCSHYLVLTVRWIRKSTYWQIDLYFISWVTSGRTEYITVIASKWDTAPMWISVGRARARSLVQLCNKIKIAVTEGQL